MNFFRENSKLSIFLLLQVICYLCLGFFQTDTASVESIYAETIFPKLSYISKFLFGYIPWSVGDIFYVFAVALLLILIYRGIQELFHKRYLAAGRQLLYFLNMVFLLYHIFTINWGLNYYRLPIEKYLKLEREQYKLADYLEFLQIQIDSANTLRAAVQLDEKKPSFSDIQTEITEFVKQDTFLKGYAANTQVRLKSSLWVRAASAVGVSGYLNPFTLEAHINTEAPAFSLPFTAVHELAHQQGIGFEDEANFVAYSRLIHAKNAGFRYAAYYQAVSYLLLELRAINPKLFEAYYQQLSPAVLGDIKKERDFWRQHTGWISDLSGIFYNQYLQQNNQQEGVARYNRMTRLILSQYLKQKGC